MNEDFRQQVIDALKRGEDLPSEWARQLFRWLSFAVSKVNLKACGYPSVTKALGVTA